MRLSVTASRFGNVGDELNPKNALVGDTGVKNNLNCSREDDDSIVNDVEAISLDTTRFDDSKTNFADVTFPYSNAR